MLTPKARQMENGTILIVTIWIVLALAGLVLVFSRSMRVEAIASANYLASIQAQSIAEGASQFIITQLNDQLDDSTVEFDSPYEQSQVGDGFFWVLRANLQDQDDLDFGITDEAAKINLNSASLEMLLKLPSMTAELATAIIDWRDEDSEVTPGGAENEYYLLLSEPYYCKNAPLETIEEVLLVKGASAEILFGEDINRNGILDDNENDAAQSDPADNKDGHLDRGFLDYVTVYSIEANVSRSGQQRININEGNNQQLATILREAIADDRYFLILNNIRRGPFKNILEFYYRSGLTYQEFESLSDRLTTSNQDNIPGLVNINTASREVLLCLPELEETDVDALLTKRDSADINLDSIAWVTEVLQPEKAVAIGEYITTQSFQHSADIVSLSGNARAYKRHRAVYDTRSDKPRIVYFKDLSHLGWPLETEIISSLRNGDSIGQI